MYVATMKGKMRKKINPRTEHIQVFCMPVCVCVYAWLCSHLIATLHLIVVDSMEMRA